jgi:hypothetical protein
MKKCIIFIREQFTGTQTQKLKIKQWRRHGFTKSAVKRKEQK